MRILMIRFDSQWIDTVRYAALLTHRHSMRFESLRYCIYQICFYALFNLFIGIPLDDVFDIASRSAIL